MSGYTDILQQLLAAGVRFVVIGVGGANYYAGSGGHLFATQDRDLFLPSDPPNLLTCWQVFLSGEWDLWCNQEPLGEPVDLWLAERVVAHQAAVKAMRPEGLEVDLTLVMEGFTFDRVWHDRHLFETEGALIPVGRLEHIVESKRLTGRPKDLLFFSTHEDLLQELLEQEISGSNCDP